MSIERTSSGAGIALAGPRRRDEILSGAIDLFRTRGFHDVGIADIGAASGITGPGVYRHFPNKHSLLVAIFDSVAFDLRRGAVQILADVPDPRDQLDALVAFHVDFALNNRAVIAVYYQEQRSLPAADRHRIRRLQRYYLDQWISVLRAVHPTMSPAEALTVVQAAIGLIASIAMHESRLGRQRLEAVIAHRARLVVFASGPTSATERC